jgi:ribose transport system substrate-binding protein
VLVHGCPPAPVIGRRSFLGLAAGLALWPGAARAQQGRYKIGFANLTEDPGVRFEGFGFTAADVRTSFALAARSLPLDMVYYDNDRNRAKTLANADDAIARKLDLYIQYCDDQGANAEIGKRMKSAGIPVIAINYPVPASPFYGADNMVAGRLAGEALVKFAATTWRGEQVTAVIVGDLANPGDHVRERAEGISSALEAATPVMAETRLDSGGNPAQADALLRRYLAAHTTGKLLIAALDDTTALTAKATVEAASRAIDTAIASQGCDRSVHGGANDKKEIDPTNRGSIVIGSVAYLLDRYGYDVLPLAMKMLAGEPVPPRTTTRHVLVTAANVFHVYPPIDMN